MADGKAGEEKPEKPQRAGAAGGEHNPSVAGRAGSSGSFFGLPGRGAEGAARRGGPGAHPARCWAQTNPGPARRGPRGPIRARIRSLMGGIVGPRRPRLRGEGRWAPRRGTAPAGPGAAVPGGGAHRPEHRRAPRGPPPRRRAGRSPGFRPGRPLGYTWRGACALRWEVCVGRGRDPGLSSLPLILKPNADPVPGRVEAAEEKGETFVCRRPAEAAGCRARVGALSRAVASCLRARCLGARRGQWGASCVLGAL